MELCTEQSPAKTFGDAAGFNCDRINGVGAYRCSWPACSCPKKGEEGTWFWWSQDTSVA